MPSNCFCLSLYIFHSEKQLDRCAIRAQNEAFNLTGAIVDIDNMTFGQLKQIAAMFGTQQPQKSSIGDCMIGQFVIARCYAAGVHAGTVEAVDGESVVLKDSRRLWGWKAADGVALSGVAQNGIVKSGSKVDSVNPKILLNGVCELIPCSQKAKESINGA
jgi:hypothetical protein